MGEVGDWIGRFGVLAPNFQSQLPDYPITRLPDSLCLALLSHDFQIATGWLEIRRRAEHLLELGDRLIDPSVPQQGAGQVRASLRISGID